MSRITAGQFIGSPPGWVCALAGCLALSLPARGVWAQRSLGELIRVCVSGDPRAAVIACTRLLDTVTMSDSARSDVYGNRGNAHDNLRQTDSALADYDRALALNARNSEAYRNRGVTLFRLHCLSEALQMFSTAIALNPRYARAWASRADVLSAAADTAASQQTLRNRALANYTRALALAGLRTEERAAASAGRGFVNYHLHHVAAAIVDFTGAIQLEPTLELYLARAVAYADNGDVNRATVDVAGASALARTPEDSAWVDEARDYIARVRGQRPN